jgi:hypothetical protein
MAGIPVKFGNIVERKVLTSMFCRCECDSHLALGNEDTAYDDEDESSNNPNHC